MDKEQLISAVVKAPQVIEYVSFPEIVEFTSGYKVIPLDLESQQDKELFNKVSGSSKHYIELCKRTRRRLQGNRINEVGNAIEEEFTQELERNGLDAKKLGEAGYPDMKLIDEYGRTTYLESKATSKGWESTLRSFYYTTGKKIDTDARHLLIGWRVNEERDKYWQIIGCRIVDLSRIKLRLKSEFNAGNKDLYENIIYELSE
ncbi:MAG: hypothetical protein ACOC80_12300 [Petrotogales bacterium]